MSLTDNPDYDLVNGTKMMVFPETVIRKAIQELKNKLKIYDMKLEHNKNKISLREHEKNNILKEIFGELAN